MELVRLSVPLDIKLWHELHDRAPDLESRVSKYNFLPNSTFAGSVMFAGLMGLIRESRTDATAAGVASAGFSAVACGVGVDCPHAAKILPPMRIDMIDALFIVPDLSVIIEIYCYKKSN